MSIVIASASLLLLSSTLILSDSQQGLVLGAVLLGSVLGGIGKVAHTLLARSESDTPKQLMVIRFCFHATIGVILGVLGMIGILHWFEVQYILLTSIASGGIAAWVGHRIVKKLEPAIIRVLQERGVIPRDLPDDATHIQAKDTDTKPIQ